MLIAENLFYSYNRKLEKNAINDISFSLEGGEILGIIGKTGSGKSTLAGLLSGLIIPDKGKVLLNGKDINKDFKSKRDIFSKIGLVFQYPENQLFEKTVFEDIAFGAINKGYSGKNLDYLVEKAISFVGLNKKTLKASPYTLSGGEKRKCAIAGILVMEPEILILDEPTAGLDLEGKDSLLESLKNYCISEKNSVIFISHVMEEVFEISDKILTLENGKSLYYGKSENCSEVNFKNLGLENTQAFEIMEIIRKRGYKVAKNIFTVKKAKEELQKILRDTEILNC